MIINVDDLLAKPYQRGARGPDGYDCWGVVIEVGKRMGIDFPDWADVNWRKSTEAVVQDQAASGDWKRIPVDQLTYGEIAVSKPMASGRHVGIHLGRGYVLHTTPRTGVLIDDINRYMLDNKGAVWAKRD